MVFDISSVTVRATDRPISSPWRERLTGPEVLRFLPEAERGLDYRRRSHVVRYMRAFADLLSARLEAEARRPEPQPALV